MYSRAYVPWRGPPSCFPVPGKEPTRCEFPTPIVVAKTAPHTGFLRPHAIQRPDAALGTTPGRAAFLWRSGRPRLASDAHHHVAAEDHVVQQLARNLDRGEPPRRGRRIHRLNARQ